MTTCLKSRELYNIYKVFTVRKLSWRKRKKVINTQWMQLCELAYYHWRKSVWQFNLLSDGYFERYEHKTCIILVLLERNWYYIFRGKYVQDRGLFLWFANSHSNHWIKMYISFILYNLKTHKNPIEIWKLSRRWNRVSMFIFWYQINNLVRVSLELNVFSWYW